MARLNDMLAKNGMLSHTLEEDNFSLEAEFINRLKDAEQVLLDATAPAHSSCSLLVLGHIEVAG